MAHNMPLTAETPVGVKAWQERIVRAHNDGESLDLRGFQSKAFLTGQRLHANLTPISTAGLGQSIEHEPSELFVRVQSAANLNDVQAVLEKAGQCLAFEPPNFSEVANSSIGGLVAAGLSGPARVSSGSLRDHVLGVSLINGLGEYLQFGGQVMKNVAGYDVSRLLCGSWGMLGLITEVTFKVLPKAPCELSLQVITSQPQALSLLAQWGTRAWPLNASVWEPHEPHESQGSQGTQGLGSDRDHSSSPQQGLWTLRFRGAVASVRASVASLLAEFKHLGLVSSELTAEEAHAYWMSVKDQRHRFFASPPLEGTLQEASRKSSFEKPVLWRLSLPLSLQHRSDILPLFASNAFTEWHGALRWFWAPLSQGLTLRQEAIALGAQLTLWKTSSILDPQEQNLGADPRTLASLFRPALTKTSNQLNKRIQQAFDPKGVFYNGCLFE